MVPADFDFADLVHWRASVIYDVVDPITPVILLGVNKRRNRVFVGVGSSDFFPDIRKALAASGVPPSALELEEVQLETCERDRKICDGNGGGSGGSQETLEEYTPQIKGGRVIATEENISGNPGQCTAGIVGIGTGDGLPAFNGAYLLTASHCTRSFTLDEVQFRQPSRTDGVVGHEMLDGEFQESWTRWCNGPYRCRHSDIALISVTSRDVGRGEIHTTEAGSITIASPSYKVTKVRGNRLNVPARVGKVGARTGDTWGQLEHHCYDLLRYDSTGEQIRFVCGNLATYHSDNGDSGAAIIIDDPDFADPQFVHAVGIHSSRVTTTSGQDFAYYTTMVGFQTDTLESDYGHWLTNINWIY